jgi:hypothetical protein
MLDSLSVIELHEAGSGHRVHGFAGGIGNEMKVKPGHRAAAVIIPAKLCVIRT